MNWMSFIIQLLDKLAWPLVALVGLMLLKKPLSMLLPLAHRLKYKDLEIEFAQQLETINQQVESAFPERQYDSKAALIKSANQLPNSTVLQAWSLVDQAAESLIMSKTPDIDLNVNSRYKLMQNILLKNHQIDSKKAKIFSELRQLRNKVAHAKDYQVGKAEAIQYVELCYMLKDYLASEVED